MIRFIVLALVAAAVVASDVVDCTDANFADTIKSAELVLVKFYAPWCGHCKKLAPEYEKAAEELKKAGVNAVLAQMDATVEKKTPEEFGVRGYPTLKVFRDGEKAGDYDGQRSAESIVQWVKGNLGPAVTLVDSEEQLNSIKEEQALLFAYIGENTGSAFETFEKIAKEKRTSYRFISVPKPEDIPTLKGKEGKVIAFKKYDDPEQTFEGDVADSKALNDFILNSALHLFTEIGPDNFKLYVDRGLPMVWLFIKPDEKEKNEPVMEAFKTVAKEERGKLSLIWVDASKYGGMAGQMGLSGKVFPAAVIDKKEMHYVHDENTPITVESLRELVKKFYEGKLERTTRSQDIPKENPVKGLWTIVGKTFEDLVMKADADVLVKFYAPWCGHCKQLAPEYAALGLRLQNVEGIRIAELDATENDFDREKFNVQGFPTLIMAKKGGEKIVTYQGSRTANDIFEWLKKESSADFSPALTEEQLKKESPQEKEEEKKDEL